ncbi:2-C-methyl-D-erythritol 2,4-cyclodiphosphate synthase [bacterium]|nr:2-C-methyl-D-erythritol 2,4-cyclodiphosphate synthase [bacterium]
MRVGWGVDAHRFKHDGVTLLAGVVVDEDRGIEATSDGDVLAHAVTDAVLGAAALGDLGMHFPSADPRWWRANSMDFIRTAVAMAADHGLTPSSVDVTVVAESVRISPHRDDIRTRLAETLQIPMAAVSVKATSTDGLGFLGRDEGIVCQAVVVLTPA